MLIPSHWDSSAILNGEGFRNAVVLSRGVFNSTSICKASMLACKSHSHRKPKGIRDLACHGAGGVTEERVLDA
jgi:hypothetical protein